MLLTVHSSLFTWRTTHPASSQPSERLARVKGISQSGFGVKVLLEKGFLRYQFGIRYGIDYATLNITNPATQCLNKQTLEAIQTFYIETLS